MFLDFSSSDSSDMFCTEECVSAVTAGAMINPSI
jgi:hypothetical protein